MQRQVDLGEYFCISKPKRWLVSINIWLLSLLTNFVCYKHILISHPLFLMENIKFNGIQTKIKSKIAFSHCISRFKDKWFLWTLQDKAISFFVSYCLCYIRLPYVNLELQNNRLVSICSANLRNKYQIS